MSGGFRAIELQGLIDQNQRLRIDTALPGADPGPVRILVLIPETDEIDESAWHQAISRNPVFDFLNDPAEDIYLPTDGKPFHDQG